MMFNNVQLFLLRSFCKSILVNMTMIVMTMKNLYKIIINPPLAVSKTIPGNVKGSLCRLWWLVSFSNEYDDDLNDDNDDDVDDTQSVCPNHFPALTPRHI